MNVYEQNKLMRKALERVVGPSAALAWQTLINVGDAPVEDNSAAAAIEYALYNPEADRSDDSFQFLKYWNEGEFDILRRNWENIPDAVFIGPDQFFVPGVK